MSGSYPPPLADPYISVPELRIYAKKPAQLKRSPFSGNPVAHLIEISLSGELLHIYFPSVKWINTSGEISISPPPQLSFLQRHQPHDHANSRYPVLSGYNSRYPSRKKGIKSLHTQGISTDGCGGWMDWWKYPCPFSRKFTASTLQTIPHHSSTLPCSIPALYALHSLIFYLNRLTVIQAQWKISTRTKISRSLMESLSLSNHDSSPSKVLEENWQSLSVTSIWRSRISTTRKSSWSFGMEGGDILLV